MHENTSTEQSFQHTIEPLYDEPNITNILRGLDDQVHSCQSEILNLEFCDV